MSFELPDVYYAGEEGTFTLLLVAVLLLGQALFAVVEEFLWS